MTQQRTTIVIDASRVTQSQLQRAVTSLRRVCRSAAVCGDVYVITSHDYDVTRRLFASQNSSNSRIQTVEATSTSLPRTQSNAVVVTSWRVDVTEHLLKTCQLYTLADDTVFVFTRGDVIRAPAAVCVNNNLIRGDVAAAEWFESFSKSNSFHTQYRFLSV